MQSEKGSVVKKIIRIYAFTGLPLCILSIIFTMNILDDPGFGAAGFILMMGLMGNLTGIVALMVWIFLLLRPGYALYIIPVFVSIHTLCWGGCWFVFSILMFFAGSFEDKTPFLFLFPSVTGLLTFLKIRKAMRPGSYYNSNDTPWPPEGNQ